MNEPHSTLKAKVLAAIKERHISMRPRWHFVLGAVLMLLGMLLFFLLLLYFSSFVFFVLRRSGAWFAPSFGPQGWFALLAALPWIFLLFVVVCIAVLELLVRKYAFAYRRPMVYSVIGIVALAVLGGFAVERAHFHSTFARFAEGNRVPFAREFYRTFGMPRPRDVHRGEVREMRVNSFVMQNEQGENVLVTVASTTLFPFGTDLEAGDAVVVFGFRSDGEIQAGGIRRITDDWMDVPLHMPMHKRMRISPPIIAP